MKNVRPDGPDVPAQTGSCLQSLRLAQSGRTSETRTRSPSWESFARCRCWRSVRSPPAQVTPRGWPGPTGAQGIRRAGVAALADEADRLRPGVEGQRDAGDHGRLPRPHPDAGRLQRGRHPGLRRPGAARQTAGRRRRAVLRRLRPGENSVFRPVRHDAPPAQALAQFAAGTGRPAGAVSGGGSEGAAGRLCRAVAAATGRRGGSGARSGACRGARPGGRAGGGGRAVSAAGPPVTTCRRGCEQSSAACSDWRAGRWQASPTSALLRRPLSRWRS